MRSTAPTVLIVLVVALAWAKILTDSPERPALLPALAGCFRAAAPAPAAEVRITRSGTLSVPGASTKVSVYEDKAGLSFLPQQKVTIQPPESGRVWIGEGNPLLLRISPDHRSFTIFDENGPDVRFDRVPCTGSA